MSKRQTTEKPETTNYSQTEDTGREVDNNSNMICSCSGESKVFVLFSFLMRDWAHFGISGVIFNAIKWHRYPATMKQHLTKVFLFVCGMTWTFSVNNYQCVCELISWVLFSSFLLCTPMLLWLSKLDGVKVLHFLFVKIVSAILDPMKFWEWVYFAKI